MNFHKTKFCNVSLLFPRLKLEKKNKKFWYKKNKKFWTIKLENYRLKSCDGSGLIFLLTPISVQIISFSFLMISMLEGETRCYVQLKWGPCSKPPRTICGCANRYLVSAKLKPDICISWFLKPHVALALCVFSCFILGWRWTINPTLEVNKFEIKASLYIHLLQGMPTRKEKFKKLKN